jgi:hypothetical protein
MRRATVQANLLVHGSMCGCWNVDQSLGWQINFAKQSFKFHMKNNDVMYLKGGNLSGIWPRTVEQDRVRDLPSAPQLLLRQAGRCCCLSPPMAPCSAGKSSHTVSLIPTWSSATSHCAQLAPHTRTTSQNKNQQTAISWIFACPHRISERQLPMWHGTVVTVKAKCQRCYGQTNPNKTKHSVTSTASSPPSTACWCPQQLRPPCQQWWLQVRPAPWSPPPQPQWCPRWPQQFRWESLCIKICYLRTCAESVCLGADDSRRQIRCNTPSTEDCTQADNSQQNNSDICR